VISPRRFIHRTTRVSPARSMSNKRRPSGRMLVRNSSPYGTTVRFGFLAPRLTLHRALPQKWLRDEQPRGAEIKSIPP
jgi:hypothetical protein